MPKRAKSQKKASSKALQDRIVVRYRRDGHLRFQIPPELRAPAVAEALEAGLLATEGIYRATVYKRAGKLAIHYMDTVLTQGQVALALVGVLDDIVAHPPEEAKEEAERPTLRERVADLGIVRRVRSRVDDWREKAQMVGALVSIKAGLPVKAGFDVERNAINFLNDLVAFYLIKAHWTQITQLWLRQPFKYRYAWLTVIYLVFLMVRYRKAAQPKKADKKQKKIDKKKT